MKYNYNKTTSNELINLGFCTKDIKEKIKWQEINELNKIAENMTEIILARKLNESMLCYSIEKEVCSSKTPDFFVETSSGGFYIECTSTSGTEYGLHKAIRKFNKSIESQIKIKKINGIHIEITTSSNIKFDTPKEMLNFENENKNSINKYIKTSSKDKGQILDYINNAIKILQNNPTSLFNVRCFESMSVNISVTQVSYNKGSISVCSVFGAWGNGINILKKIEQKANRYNDNCDRPVIIFLSSKDALLDSEGIEKDLVVAAKNHHKNMSNIMGVIWSGSAIYNTEEIRNTRFFKNPYYDGPEVDETRYLFDREVLCDLNLMTK